MSELKINQRQLNGQLSDSEYNKSETAHEVFNINGYVQIEERITNGTSIEPGVSYPLTLKADEYFILADARGDAKDSRLFGPVSRDHILGRVAFLLRMDDF